ncbi:unnamed protein product [Triticum turgidum subsp. durum]|uniref:Rit1 DUSP-like domain-containing protein n=1 Tax=Triticum turgidum subsp. durum TaxID=4567 RepID=A0A9R0ZIU8_TRITD|nr:unnamed protein product [Triticum turgidum subsp. durum]
MNSNPSTLAPANTQYSNDGHVVFWIGTSNIAVASTMQAHQDCLLIHQKILTLNYLLWLVILFLPFVFPFYSDINIYISVLQDSKDERFSLLKNLPKAVSFAKKNLIARRKMLLCCQSGEDISICVALAIITRLFNDTGCFDCGESFMRRDITKLEMRKRLVFICKYAVNARPSRGNLRQVYGFLCNEKEQLPH